MFCIWQTIGFTGIVWQLFGNNGAIKLPLEGVAKTT